MFSLLYIWKVMWLLIWGSNGVKKYDRIFTEPNFFLRILSGTYIRPWFYKFIIFIYIWRTPKNHYTTYLYFEELSYYTNKSPCFKITISDKFHVKITLLQYNQPVYPTPDIDINFSNNLNSYNLPTQYFITQIYWISKIHFFPPHTL